MSKKQLFTSDIIDNYIENSLLKTASRFTMPYPYAKNKHVSKGK